MTKTFRRSVVAVLALAGAAAFAPPAAEAGNRDFSLANRLPWTTISVFVRPTGTTGWSGDLLGSEVLPSGRDAFLRLGNGAACVFDIKLGLPDRTEAVFNGVNLCTLTSMSVFWDGAVRASLRGL